jgi:hypothetical protein
MVAATSFMAGRFLEAARPIINVALLAGSSALFAEALAAALVRHGRLQATEMPPMLVASAVAITTLLNPGLDGAVVFSSYADCGTMVAVGALGLLGVEILARVSLGGTTNVQGLAWRFGFVGAMLVNLKQANPVLLALVTVGLILVALRDPAIGPRRVLAQLPRMLGPAIFLFALWRWYVSQNSPDSEQAFRPFDTWNFGVLRQTFAAIGSIIADTPLFHSMMWLVTVAGFAVFFPFTPQSERGAMAGGDLRHGVARLQFLPVDRLSRRHESQRCSNCSRLLALYATRGAAGAVRPGHGAGDRTLADLDEPAGWCCHGCGRAAGSLRHASSRRSQQSGGQGVATLPPRRRNRHAAHHTPCGEVADRAGRE